MEAPPPQVESQMRAATQGETPAAANADFDAYGASIYEGPIAKPDLAAYPGFQSRIGEGRRFDVNFGGHFSIVEVSCGTGCRNALLVDVRNGEAEPLPVGGESQPYLQLEYRADSNLLHASWEEVESGVSNCVTQDFVRTDEGFTAQPSASTPGNC